MLHNQMYEAFVNLVGPDVVTRARLSHRSAYFIGKLCIIYIQTLV